MSGDVCYLERQWGNVFVEVMIFKKSDDEKYYLAVWPTKDDESQCFVVYEVTEDRLKRMSIQFNVRDFEGFRGRYKWPVRWEILKIHRGAVLEG
jgi:hypothetical protein